ncbi:MAG: hypothetical protein ABI882_22405 [Acidobacteriota bacterium]
MKRFLTAILAVSMTGLLSLSALGQQKEFKERFKFNRDILVGTTLVKKGEYLVRFNPNTNQMSIHDGPRVVAQVAATVKMSDRKFDQGALMTIDSAEGLRLSGLRIGGEREELIF